MLSRVQRGWKVLELLLFRDPGKDPESSVGIGSQLRTQQRKGWNITETGKSLSRKQVSMGQ